MSTVQLQIGPADHGRQMSLEEFREAEEEEGYRYELAEGVLEVTEIPGPEHRRVVSNLYRAIAQLRSGTSRQDRVLRRRLRIPALDPGAIFGPKP